MSALDHPVRRGEIVCDEEYYYWIYKNEKLISEGNHPTVQRVRN